MLTNESVHTVAAKASRGERAEVVVVDGHPAGQRKHTNESNGGTSRGVVVVVAVDLGRRQPVGVQQYP